MSHLFFPFRLTDKGIFAILNTKNQEKIKYLLKYHKAEEKNFKGPHTFTTEK